MNNYPAGKFIDLELMLFWGVRKVNLLKKAQTQKYLVVGVTIAGQFLKLLILTYVCMYVCKPH